MKTLTKHLFSKKTLFICAFIMLFFSCGYAANPIIPYPYTADPSPHQWSDGKYYLYCSHDKDTDVDWDMEDYHVFSSTDLVNWTDHGIAFRKTDSPFGNGAALWAPDCMYRNGMYYLYYPQNSKIGVATSTSPTGPFTNAKFLYQTANSAYSYDPMIFVDDDNQPYLLVSSAMNSGGFVPVLCKLGADMESITQETILSTTGNFHEGPWMFKRNGIYYLAWGGGSCDYSTSTNLLGPYTYKGTIANQWRDAGGNLISGDQQHPGVANFGGQWYFASAWGAPDNKRRQVFMQYMYFNADGTIKFITPDMQGVIAPGIPFGQVEAENYNSMSGVQMETCSDTTGGGYDIGYIENGDYLVFQNMNFGTGANSFQARVASANSGGNIEVHLDSLTGPLVGTCAVSGTGGWQTWVTKSCSISGASGTHNLYLKFTGGSGSLLNLNWFTFIATYPTPSPTPIPIPTPTPSPTPIPGTLDRTGWTASASLNTGAAGNALDGKAGTRWDTGAYQTNGQWFMVDMKTSKTFDKITLDTTNSPNDYPRGYQVTVSNDGTNFGSIIASGPGSSAITTITFTTQTARFVKVTQTGTASSYYWSIHEFNVFNTGATPTPAPTPTPTPTPAGGATLDTCDALTGWSSHNTLSLDTTNKQQGTGCLSETGAIEGQFWKSFSTAVNAGVTESAGYIEFEYYISDATKLGTNCQIEISSSGAADVNEYFWSMPMGLVNGWNHFKLKLSNAGKTGTPNLSAINWFRIYNFVTASVTAKIDNIRFTP
jgi:arabinoxylan arabinofuranohydrolase